MSIDTIAFWIIAFGFIGNFIVIGSVVDIGEKIIRKINQLEEKIEEIENSISEIQENNENE